MSLPRYGEYRDSGVEWLGEVPAHWLVLSIKRLTSVQRGASPRPIEDAKYFDDDGEYSWVRIADVSASAGKLITTTQRMSELGASLSVKIAPGELFVSIAGTVGKPCISAIKACIHDGFVYFPHLRIAPKFLYRIFEAGYCYGGLGKFGTQLNLNTDTIGSIRVGIPPEAELAGILEFLDRETAKIDALIAEQEKLIALLAEKRQATISHAVTKGLDPNAPMKNSGVAWLGEVPAHWDIVRVKALSQFTTSGPRGWSDRITDSGSLFIQSGDLNDSLGLELETAKRVNVGDDAEAARTRLSEGDVVVCITGAKTGNVALCESLPEPAYVNQHLCLVRPSEDVHGRFLALSLKSSVGQTQIELSQYGLKQGLSLENVRELLVTRPPREEQEAIVEFLDEETGKLTALALSAAAGVSLLKERRSALIAAAVTGQIDVRSA